jgi:hypothetical protein
MSLAEKFSVGVVCVVAIITMGCAIVRVVAWDSSIQGHGGQVHPTWSILWAGIEGCVGESLSHVELDSLSIDARNHGFDSNTVPQPSSSAASPPLPS